MATPPALGSSLSGAASTRTMRPLDFSKAPHGTPHQPPSTTGGPSGINQRTRGIPRLAVRMVGRAARGLYSVGPPLLPPLPHSPRLSLHAPRRVGMPPPRCCQGQVPSLRSVVPILAVLASALRLCSSSRLRSPPLASASIGRRCCLVVIDFFQTKNSFLFCCSL